MTSGLFPWLDEARGSDQMVRRKGELSSRIIDRDWPHQVALRADLVKGRSSEIKDEFCRDLSLCPCPTARPFPAAG
jgi:hypothetical protein